MKRKIIKIDEEKCIGCGACAQACHEGAIAMLDGKARLVREDYCDGLGDCLPTCPVDAISFEEREAPAYDAAAAEAAKAQNRRADEALPCGCPGTHAKAIQREGGQSRAAQVKAVSRLSQWPVQIKLVPENAAYLSGADLLIAADCTAYAYGSFHDEFIGGKITLIGCPKLDDGDYADKLTVIITRNDIKSITVARMEVPCCGGLESAVRRAISASGKPIPLSVVTISTDGRVIGG